MRPAHRDFDTTSIEIGYRAWAHMVIENLTWPVPAVVWATDPRESIARSIRQAA